MKNQKLYPFILMAFVLSLFAACEKPTNASKQLPSVITGQAVTNTDGTAECSAYVESAGDGVVYDRGICYAKGDETPNLADFHVSNGNGIGSYTCKLEKLDEGLYSYCAFAVNEAGTAYGKTKTFTMPEKSAEGGGEQGGGEEGGGEQGGGEQGGGEQGGGEQGGGEQGGGEQGGGEQGGGEEGGGEQGGGSGDTEPEMPTSYAQNGDKIVKLVSGNCQIQYHYQVSPSFYSSRVVRLYDENGALKFFVSTHSLASMSSIDLGSWYYEGGWSTATNTYLGYGFWGGSFETSSMKSMKVSRQGGLYIIDAVISNTEKIHFEGPISLTIG